MPSQPVEAGIVVAHTPTARIGGTAPVIVGVRHVFQLVPDLKPRVSLSPGPKSSQNTSLNTSAFVEGKAHGRGHVGRLSLRGQDRLLVSELFEALEALLCPVDAGVAEDGAADPDGFRRMPRNALFFAPTPSWPSEQSLVGLEKP